MRKVSLIVVLAMLATAFILPLQAFADPTASINATLDTMPGFPQYIPEHGSFAAGWVANAAGLPYTVTWSNLDASKNYMIVILGEATSVSYGTDITINANTINEYDPQTLNPSWYVPGLITAVADMSASADQKGPEGQGPPAESKGMWVSTNAPNWNMYPGEFDEKTHKPKSFRIEVEGPSGVSGFFKWYWPKALLDFMNMKISDLAGFIDGDQMSVNTTTYPDGSGLVSINLTYSKHIVKTAKALPISLASNKKSLRRKAKNKKVKLFGWLSAKRAKKVIEVYRKIKGQKKYSLLGRVKTGAKGYYKRTIPVTKTTSFYTRTKSGKRWLKSPVKLVRVR